MTYHSVEKSKMEEMSKTILGDCYSTPVTWGAGGGGARVAINDEFARWSRMERRWKKCLFTSPALLIERWAVISAIFDRWKDASLSHPPRVSTTSGMKVIPWRRHDWKCLPIFAFFIFSRAAPVLLLACCRLDAQSGEVTAMSKACGRSLKWGM